jgi:hypothetical protein
MKPNEAEALVDFLRAAFPSLTDEQVDVYQSSLLFEEAELASKAILAGIREWKHPPRYAEIVERIRMERRAVMGSIPASVEQAIEDLSIPRWVKRWIYARFILSPADMRVFREQFPDLARRGDTPEHGWMPNEEYDDKADMISDLFVRQTIVKVAGGQTTAELSKVLKDTAPSG